MESDQTRAVASWHLGGTFAIVLTAVATSAVYASIECRGLYQDGAYYLYRIAEREGFYLFDPARATVQAMRQAPVVLLTRFGHFSLVERAQAFSLAMLLIPVLMCALCWFIVPVGRKAWTLFPVLHLLIGVSSTSFNAVGEATIATSYFWLLLLLLIFRSRHVLSQVLFLLLCIPAMFLHEGAFLLTLVLLFACAMRVRYAQGFQEHVFLLFSAGLLVAIFIYELGWVIEPRIPGGRETEFRALYRLEFLVSEGRVNLPVVTGTLAFCALAVIVIAQMKVPAFARAWSEFVGMAFVLFALSAVAIAWLIEPSFAPRAQVLARYHPVYVSTVLGVAAVTLARRGVLERLPLKVCCLLIVIPLCCAQIAADVVATGRWRSYLIDLQSRLATQSGLISWQSTLTTGDARRDLDWELMNADWVIPMMSIIFARAGIVRAMIDLPPEMTFRPLDPKKPGALPRLRGIDYGPYRRALASQPTDDR